MSVTIPKSIAEVLKKSLSIARAHLKEVLVAVYALDVEHVRGSDSPLTLFVVIREELTDYQAKILKDLFRKLASKHKHPIQLAILTRNHLDARHLHESYDVLLDTRAYTSLLPPDITSRHVTRLAGLEIAQLLPESQTVVIPTPTLASKAAALAMSAKITAMKWYASWQRRTKKLVRSGVKSRSNTRGGSYQSRVQRATLVRNLSLAALGSVVLGTLVVGLLFAWYARDLPRPDRIVRQEGFATKILDRNGVILYEVFADQQRTPITIDQVPDYLKQATVATEDKNFYTHGGFDPKGMARAVFTNLTTSSKVGGSTLTQQLVKNVLLTTEKSYARKIKEFILAIQIESQYNKDEILQMYLNEAPYGGTAWGVQTAAQTYFAKDTQDLTLIESAILAGMPQRPSVYSPYSKDPTAYIGRTQTVLRRMREDGYITEEEEASASASLEDVKFQEGVSGLKAPHFSLYVKQLLEDMYDENLVAKGGLRVTTTLDYELQEAAQEIVTQEIAEVEDQGISNGAAVVSDPQTGEILAMVGSKDFFAEDYDGQVNVALALRQPGSTIKPVTYATAFAQGYTPAYMLMDVKTDFPGGAGKTYTPVNYDGNYRGPVQMRFALGSSLNVPAVKLLAEVGVENMLQTAYDMGFETLEPTKENLSRFGLSVTLGGGEVRLLDLTNAYSAFANGGRRVEPISILKVEDRDGKTLFEHKHVDGPEVLDKSVTFLINHVLTDNNARLLTFGANSYLNMGGRPIAVKTGTTNDKRDNWTIGWSQSSMVGVWVGNNDNSAMGNVASGVTGSSPIWRNIMVKLLETRPAEAWEIPSDVEAVKVDTTSGYPEHHGFPARTEYVIKGTLPSEPDPIHAMLKICRGDDTKLASDIDIDTGNYDEKEYFVFKEDVILGDAPSWQEGIDAWVASSSDPKYHPPTEICDSDRQAQVEIRRPGNEENISGNSVEVEVRAIAQKTVEEVQIFVDDKRVETLRDRPYTTTLELESGAHRLHAIAKLEGGGEERSGDVRIGVGGVPWQGEPTPTTAPEPSPTIAPSPTKKIEQ